LKKAKDEIRGRFHPTPLAQVVDDFYKIALYTLHNTLLCDQVQCLAALCVQLLVGV